MHGGEWLPLLLDAPPAATPVVVALAGWREERQANPLL